MKKILSVLMFCGSAGLTMTSYAQSTVHVAVTPTVSAASAYTSGDVVGGVMTFPVFKANTGTGVLANVMILDRGNQKAAMTLLFFSKNPSHGTYTDNGAFAIDSIDMESLICRVNIATGDYQTVGTYAQAEVQAIGKAIVNTDSRVTLFGTNLYVVMITTGTPTYNATTNIVVRTGVLRDGS